MPAVRRSIVSRWMNSMLPTSSPRVGWSRTRSFGSRPSSRATTTFCWLPPDSVPAFTQDRRRSDVELGHALVRAGADRVVVAHEAAGEGRGVVVVEDDVVGDREGEDEAEPMPVGGHEADADAVEVARRGCGHVLVAERHAAGRLAPQPHDRLDQLVLAVARHAGDPEDLAGADLEADAVDDLVAAIVGHPEVARP